MGWIETKTIGNLSEVSFDREPDVSYGVPREPNPNNDPNKGFGRKYMFHELPGKPVTLTFTPKEGYAIVRVGVGFGDKYRNFVTATPEREGEESIYVADSGFVDNGDGSFSFTVTEKGKGRCRPTICHGMTSC